MGWKIAVGASMFVLVTAACGSDDSAAVDASGPQVGADADLSAPDADPNAPDADPSAVDAGPLPLCDPAPAGADSEAALALEKTNALRLAMGIGCQTQQATINTSAKLHCDYYAANTGMCTANAHVEVSGCTLFVASSFSARMSAAGYTGQARFEDMAFVGNSNAVTVWVNSIWHRTPILSPWIGDQGYGRATGCDTMDFGRGTVSASDVVAFYPYHNQTGVPRSFSGNEGPPPPAPPGGFPSGYPIHVFMQSAVLTTHTLRVSGTQTDIPHVWLTPADSNLLSNEHVMYANEPLAATTKYEVHVAGTHNGSPFDRTFDFTTN